MDVVSDVVSSVVDTDGNTSFSDNLRKPGENKPEGFPWEQNRREKIRTVRSYSGAAAAL